MIRQIRFSNYRSFSDETTIALRPITVLVGPNSGGKSSILKLFYLLAQSYTDGFPGELIRWDGPRVNLLSGKGVAFSLSEEVAIEYHLETSADSYEAWDDAKVVVRFASQGKSVRAFCKGEIIPPKGNALDLLGPDAIRELLELSDPVDSATRQTPDEQSDDVIQHGAKQHSPEQGDEWSGAPGGAVSLRRVDGVTSLAVPAEVLGDILGELAIYREAGLEYILSEWEKESLRGIDLERVTKRVFSRARHFSIGGRGLQLGQIYSRWRPPDYDEDILGRVYLSDGHPLRGESNVRTWMWSDDVQKNVAAIAGWKRKIEQKRSAFSEEALREILLFVLFATVITNVERAAQSAGRLLQGVIGKAIAESAGAIRGIGALRPPPRSIYSLVELCETLYPGTSSGLLSYETVKRLESRVIAMMSLLSLRIDLDIERHAIGAQKLFSITLVDRDTGKRTP